MNEKKYQKENNNNNNNKNKRKKRKKGRSFPISLIVRVYPAETLKMSDHRNKMLWLFKVAKRAFYRVYFYVLQSNESP